MAEAIGASQEELRHGSVAAGAVEVTVVDDSQPSQEAAIEVHDSQEGREAAAAVRPLPQEARPSLAVAPRVTLRFCRFPSSLNPQYLDLSGAEPDHSGHEDLSS